MTWLIALGMYASFSCAAAEPPAQVLTDISAVKTLEPSEAGASVPVRLRGVITVSLGPKGGAFLQDETGGIFIGPRKGQSVFVSMGDWVECVGTTAVGQYAPRIEVDRIEPLGQKPIPEPARLSLADFSAGTHDAAWVETEGTVRSMRTLPDGRIELQIAVGRERLRAEIRDPSAARSDTLIDTVVRVRGAASGYFNQSRQLLVPVLIMPDWSHLTIIRPGYAHPFEAPLRSTSSLFRYAPDTRWGNLYKVRGTVMHFVPGKAVFLRDDDGPIYGETTGIVPLKPGDVIELAGFPVSGLRGAYLQDAVYRIVGAAAEPLPVQAEGAAIVYGRTPLAELIAIEGVLGESTRLRDTVILTLRSGEQSFEVHLDAAAGAAQLKLPDIGSRLRVTGVVWTEVTEPRGRRQIVAESFRVLSRSPADIVVVERASWLTLERLQRIVLSLLVTVVAALVWIWLLRRRVEAQTSTIAEKVAREAVAEERAKTACELHDTLAQSFTAVGFQLEALAREMGDSPLHAQQHLDRAMKMLRHSHDEVRHSLKQLRDPEAMRKPLGAALREALERSVGEAASDQIRYIERGEPFSLLPMAEHNILRVGQEAAANAAKHAGADNLEVELHFDRDEVRLRVVDDGCGFAEEAPVSADHFGLQIMHERARRIGGRLLIRSHPGQGTQILLAVPRARASSA